MRCVFINLDAASERRRQVEEGFAAHAPAGWDLVRLAATPAEAVADEAGVLSPSAKACYRSHLRALEATSGDDAPVLIVEDDVRFTSRMFGLIEGALDTGWDVVLPEAVVGDAANLMWMLKFRPERVRDGRFDLLDLKSIAFASAAAYAVRGPAKRRLHALLAAQAPLNTPYDIALRQVVHAGHVKAALIFPFVSSITEAADASQVDGSKAADFVSNTFRRAMFVERDEAACRAAADRIHDEIADDDARLAGAIMAGFLSPRFQRK